ncbi:enoyl-CoA hydratase/isomerase family protein [Tropicibacter sp. R16_0]|uniref:enoyl-CoA hydratase/isomerase family protein n=1 Tax=Tropicibacter sp. R16_0 TaxID=2821102 RepID=UPI001ADCE3F4|nr:enoyl-CoA hydratase/isomerase family protein [Tropicibacter sp. R16_0]MBO9449693.1 enoyl-CoA hydratase/isomerase family protein [Tropicibacter sp. R16_0]
MSATQHLNRINHDGGIVEIGLNRAPVNALSPEFLFDFKDLLDGLAIESEVRAIVLTSPFKVFSAGLDLKEAQEFDLGQQNAIVEGLNVGFLSLFANPKPVVCSVDGAAIAGGLFFVLGSDIRVASPRAKLGLAEVRVGANFPVGPLEIARATLAPDALRRLMLTGQPLDAEEAHRYGIVDALTEGSSRDRAMAEAQALAQLPPKTYASIKQQIRGGAIEIIEQAMRDGANRSETGWFSDETKPAMQRMIG